MKCYLKECLVFDDDELRPRLVLTVNHVHVETTLLQHTHINVLQSVVTVKSVITTVRYKTHMSDEEVGQQVVILNTTIQLHQEETERKHTQ